MSTLIRSIEEHSIRALPALETRYVDGWVLRFAERYTRRANSIQPLYDTSSMVDHNIDLCESLYTNRNMNVYFKMTEAACPEHLDARLDERGYIRQAPTSVQTLPLASITPQMSSRAQIQEKLSHQWAADYCRLNQVDPKFHDTVRWILTRIIPKSAFIRLREGDETLAVGLGVFDAGMIGLFDIVTHNQRRREGLATELIHSLLDWGKDQGAELAYLQVMTDNDPALKLYDKLGFRDVYQYWYRARLL